MNDIIKISYSQLKTYTECPLHWKLSYIDKLRSSEPSIVLVFGNAMHEVLQSYLVSFYSKPIKETDQMDLNKLLADRLKYHYTQSKIEGNGVDFCTKEDMLEFYYDGVKILNFFKTNRNKYFKKRNHDLLGIELELSFPIKNNINFIGYLDVVVRDNDRGRIKIYDLKTSIRGWNKWMKSDKTRINQLLLYKKFYSEQFNIPLNRIDVEFFILKRKLYENMDFAQKRIQTIEPPNGTISVNRAMTTLDSFINEAFTRDGKYNVDREYIPTPSKSACRYCEFNNNTLCGVGIK